MTAEELVVKTVKKRSQENAHVRALIPDKDSWWHVHRDEELPADYPVVVYIRI